ncbi:hypothetical protein [Bacillus weihaiensis]|uniref:Uncharacterized protein n=1 Tax=Bacillus weihaiensis TaxID=1547283 RepID=A0A1L3MY12_9BACI|nr:hypothetical protein [Bacillus weihaiensis]APH07213.1 hypothetical protein A9C19_20730 [Bacillus weihaiensis]
MMRPYEKEILRREMISLVYSYPYKVVPLSDDAKLAFALFNKQRGPIPPNAAEVIKKYLNLEKPPFIGQMSFYYDDPNESEDARMIMTKELAIKKMAECWVPGISHVDSLRKNSYPPLKEGSDFTIEVGKKIIHDQPLTLTFDDIKAL